MNLPPDIAMTDVIGPDSVVIDLRAANKARLIAEISKRAAAQTGLGADAILSALNAREALGSTGIGKGIALPHAKIGGLECAWGFFARLASPIEFDAIDEHRVDLVFLLLTPDGANSDHIKVLSLVSRILRDEETRNRVRAAKSAAAIHALLAAVPA